MTGFDDASAKQKSLSSSGSSELRLTRCFQKRLLWPSILATLLPFLLLRMVIFYDVHTPADPSVVVKSEKLFVQRHPRNSLEKPSSTRPNVNMPTTHKKTLVRPDEDAWITHDAWINHKKSPKNSGRSFTKEENAKKSTGRHPPVTHKSSGRKKDVQNLRFPEDNENEDPVALLMVGKEEETKTDEKTRAGEKISTNVRGKKVAEEGTKAAEEEAAQKKRNEEEKNMKTEEEKHAEKMRKAEQWRGADEKRKDAERKVKEEQKAAEKRETEERRKANEQKGKDEQREAEEKTVKEELERAAAQEREAEEKRRVEEQMKAAEQREAEDLKKLNEENAAAVEREAEEKRKAEEQKGTAEQREAEQKKLNEETAAAVEREAEEKRKEAEQRAATEQTEASEMNFNGVSAESEVGEHRQVTEQKRADEQRVAEEKDAEEQNLAKESEHNEEQNHLDKREDDSGPAQEVTTPDFHTEEATDSVGECDLFDGDWEYDPEGPLYTNSTCFYIRGDQNCMANGRPDTEYLHWRWKPRDCDLPRFDARSFLEKFRGKSIGFVGDSLARNQMQSLLCMLSQVEVPVLVYENNTSMNVRWLYEQHQVGVAVAWSPYLLQESQEGSFGFEKGQSVLYLDVVDPVWTAMLPDLDILVLSTGQWYFKPSVYIKQDEVVGCHYCPTLNLTEIGFTEPYREGLRQALDKVTAEFKGIAIMSTFAIQHFEDGPWSDGGQCRRERPLNKEELLVLFPGFHDEMRDVVMDEYNRIDKSKLNEDLHLDFLDVTKVSLLRADGHPGPFRNFNPFQGKSPDEWVPNDCLHWCLPGPVDTWNQLLVKIAHRYL